MAKIPRIIHHNQLLSTKFGRILQYVKNDVDCSAKKQLTEKTWGRVALVNGETFHSFHREEIGELLAKKHGKNSKKTARRTTSAVWAIFAELDNPLSPKFDDKHACTNEDELNIDGGKHVLACF